MAGTTSNILNETQSIVVDVTEQQLLINKNVRTQLRQSVVNLKISSDNHTNSDSVQYSAVPSPPDHNDGTELLPLASITTPICEHIDLGFSDISYTVKQGIFGREEKCILKNLSGDFLSGELTVIMGPSGSGKSTLLDILSGYTYLGANGNISINGIQRSFDNICLDSCYIMQEDNLQPLLTVQEALNIAAHLKLPEKLSRDDRKEKVEEIITAIGLQKCRKTQIRYLSGGESKRLSIALELLRNPSVMFFDEPTSGLDSSVSKQCITLLKDLAREGRTVICTIHQPSAILLEMFDHLYIISEGLCIYQGSVKGLLPYLNEMNLNCPTYHNPADFVLEVCQGQYGDRMDELVERSENGKNSDWRRNPNFKRHQVGYIENAKTETKIKMANLKSKELNINDNMTDDDITKELYTKKEFVYPRSFFVQFFILLYRTVLILSRDRTLTYSRIFIHIAISLFIGTLYYRIGDDATYMLDNCNYLFFSIMFLMFTAFSSMTITFPLEVPIVSREYFNRWYSLKSYYLAVTIADMPIQILSTVIYVMVTFYLTAQPFEAFRFCLFLAMCIIVSFVSQSIGVLCGSVMNVTNVTIFGPFFICPFLMFSGFFIHFNDAHPWFRWLFHTSFLKHAFEGLMLSVFGYDRPRLPCSSDYCHYMTPSKLIDQIAMPNADYGHAVMVLIILYFVLRTVSYLVLLYRLQHNRDVLSAIHCQIYQVCHR